jgi:hypothetical protein
LGIVVTPAPDWRVSRGAIALGRSERRDFFERLLPLRAGYGSHEDDRRTVLSIEDAVIHAEAVLHALDEPAWEDGELAGDFPAEPAPERRG